jgi:hypothetical protein
LSDFFASSIGAKNSHGDHSTQDHARSTDPARHHWADVQPPRAFPAVAKFITCLRIRFGCGVNTTRPRTLPSTKPPDTKNSECSKAPNTNSVSKTNYPDALEIKPGFGFAALKHTLRAMLDGTPAIYQPQLWDLAQDDCMAMWHVDQELTRKLSATR